MKKKIAKTTIFVCMAISFSAAWKEVYTTYRKFTHPINIATYFFPFLGASLNEISSLDPGKISAELKERVLTKCKKLTALVGLKENTVSFYRWSQNQLGSNGGKHSWTSPNVCIPSHLLDGAKEKDWVYSEKEIDYLIVRELINIKQEYNLLRLAIKVVTLAAFVFMYFSPIVPLGIVLFATALSVAIFVERFLQKRLDVQAAEKLEGGIEIAIATLEKTKAQNIERRNLSKWAKLLTTPDGTELYDILRPPLNARIENLKKIYSVFK